MPSAWGLGLPGRGEGREVPERYGGGGNDFSIPAEGGKRARPSPGRASVVEPRGQLLAAVLNPDLTRSFDGSMP